MTDIKNCPFCDWMVVCDITNKEIQEWGGRITTYYILSIECSHCGVIMEKRISAGWLHGKLLPFSDEDIHKDNLIKKWNKRDYKPLSNITNEFVGPYLQENDFHRRCFNPNNCLGGGSFCHCDINISHDELERLLMVEAGIIEFKFLNKSEMSND